MPTRNTLYAKWQYELRGIEDDAARVQRIEEHRKEYKKLDVKMYPSLNELSRLNSFLIA